MTDLLINAAMKLKQEQHPESEIHERARTATKILSRKPGLTKFRKPPINCSFSISTQILSS